MTGRMVTVDPVEDTTWAELAIRGSLFASPPWLGAIRDTYGLEPEGWLAYSPEDELVGGLPVLGLGEGSWQRLSSLPFSDFSNPIDLDGSAWPLIAARLTASGLPVELRCLGDVSPVADGRFVTAGPPDLWHGIALDVDEARAWANLDGSARRAIRKAGESEVVIRASEDLSSLRAFYELHLGTRKHKYRLLAQPFDFFTNLHKRFGTDMTVLGAWQDDTMVAGILLLSWGNVLYYKFNASSPAALAVRPNDLLMWEATRFGVSRGLGLLDLGRTDSDHQSLARYKSKYATEQRFITTVRSGDYRRDPMVGAILGPMTEILTRPGIPDELTEEAGSLMYHHFA
jgi:hypothetical protein